MAHRLRIQRKRTKGFKLPSGTVCVSRPSKWGNPFEISSAIEAGYATTDDEARKLCVNAYRDWLVYDPRVAWRICEFWLDGDEWNRKRDVILDSLDALEGRWLACYCRIDQVCHADVLAELANCS